MVNCKRFLGFTLLCLANGALTILISKKSLILFKGNSILCTESLILPEAFVSPVVCGPCFPVTLRLCFDMNTGFIRICFPPSR